MAFSYRLDTKGDTKTDTKIESKLYKGHFYRLFLLTPLHILYKTHPYFH